MKDNPELQNKEVDKLKNDLEKEKKQTTFLQSQLATLRTQMSTDLALIKNKEAQIKGNFFLNRLGPIPRDNNAEGIVFRKRFNNQETFSGG